MTKISRTGSPGGKGWVDRPMRPLPVNFTLLDRALLAFYAKEKDRSMAEVVRKMVRLYFRKDKEFRADDFVTFVTNDLGADVVFEEDYQELVGLAKQWAESKKHPPEAPSQDPMWTPPGKTLRKK